MIKSANMKGTSSNVFHLKSGNGTSWQGTSPHGGSDCVDRVVRSKRREKIQKNVRVSDKDTSILKEKLDQRLFEMRERDKVHIFTK